MSGLFSFLKKLFGGGVPGMRPEEARQWLAANPGAIILDVRQPDEHKGGHLPKARLVPVATVAQKSKQLDKEAKYLVYCHLGPRANKAASTLAREGFEDVRTLQGGIVAWRRAGFPIDKK